MSKLIKLKDGLIVSSDLILAANRCGNYTHIFFKNDRMLMEQIWDEDLTVWNRIEKSTESSPTVEREGVK